ncbi:MAG: hypothetical protein ABI629_11175 [bacterium]
MALRSLILGLSTFVLFVVPSPAAARCTGDCDRSGAVGISELVLGVNIALGEAPLESCNAFPACDIGPVCVADLIKAVGQALGGCPLVTLPEIVASEPLEGALNIPRSTWIRVEFAGAVDPQDLDGQVAIDCGQANASMTGRVTALKPNVLLINPTEIAQLAGGAACSVRLANRSLHFTVAAAGAPATVLYDRDDARRLAPLPDDVFTVTEATATGVRVVVPLPDGPADLQQIFGGLLPETNRLDGFSPIAHWVIELSDAVDPASLPLTPTASLDPLASVLLYDLSGIAPRRVPFRLEPRTDVSVAGVTTHSLLLYPSIPLEPRHHFGLILTRRVLADAARPFEAAPYFTRCLAAGDGADARCRRMRDLAQEVLAAAAQADGPPLDADEIALAVRVTVRSTDAIPRDQLAVREQVFAAPPPAFSITSVEAGSGGQVAAIVHGTWQAPDWRDANGDFVRDAAGAPVQTMTKAVPFTLALPEAALAGPVPIIMYQHGNPGSSEAEVPSAARRSLAAEGFAVIGFTDTLNRELSAGISDRDQAILAQVVPVLQGILARAKIPDFWAETRAEQLAFVRLLDGLGGLDVLPLGAPDGVADLDPTLPRGYLGISEGANNGPGIVPYAPEIHAAALVAGGARLGEVLIYQSADLFLTSLGAAFPSLTPTELWVGVSLFQHIFDNQDAHNHARFIYRAPVVAGGTTRKASVLLIEGLNDTLVPNHATDSLAWALAPLPHLAPVQRAVPFLDVVSGSITANIDADTTAAFFQYVPTGVAGIDPTPGCAVLTPSSASEGHYCAQGAAESFRQRAVFFKTALTGVPTIIDPFAETADLSLSASDARVR